MTNAVLHALLRFVGFVPAKLRSELLPLYPHLVVWWWHFSPSSWTTAFKSDRIDNLTWFISSIVDTCYCFSAYYSFLIASAVLYSIMSMTSSCFWSSCVFVLFSSHFLPIMHTQRRWGWSSRFSTSSYVRLSLLVRMDVSVIDSMKRCYRFSWHHV